MTQRITINTPIVFSDPLPDSVDLVVIGGGVIGIFTALYAAQMGQRVLVCEKGRIAAEQSSRNWGWIRQHGRDAAELPIMMQALRLWHQTHEATHQACGVKTVGVNFLASSEAEVEQLHLWLDIAKQHDLDTHPLSRKQLNGLFRGHASQQWCGGLATPSDARGEPWQAVPKVAQLAHAQGVIIRENCAVRGLDLAAGQVVGVYTEQGRVACSQVVLAGGAWSSLMARNLGLYLPQLTVQASVAQTQPMDAFTEANSVDERLAIRRRADGGYSLALADSHRVYVGPDALRHARAYLPLLGKSWRHLRLASVSPKGFPDAWSTPRRWAADQLSPFEQNRVLEPKTDVGMEKLMLKRFQQRFPNISLPRIKDRWSGMIDTMPDVVPVVDRIAEVPGLIVATGMSGHGFGIGPGFGRVVARMVNERLAEHDLSRFRYNRFSDGSQLELGPSL